MTATNSAVDVKKLEDTMDKTDLPMNIGALPPESKFDSLEYWKDRSNKLESLNAEAVASLKDCLLVIEMLMPGLRHTVVQDYAFINEAPVKARQVVAKMESPGEELYKKTRNSSQPGE